MIIQQSLLPSSKYYLKSRRTMTPTFITIHNTWNDASAKNEIGFMKRNSKTTSYHVAVDDVEAIQAIPFTRIAHHTATTRGNNCSIGIEICYSTDYNTNRHEKAFYNTVDVVKQLMKKYNIPIKNVVQHNYWSGKDCPHRIRKEGTWDKFKALCVEKEGTMGTFKLGYQLVYWGGQAVHAYAQRDNEEIGLMSTSNPKQLLPITAIDDSHIHSCKINCSYFIMGDGQVLGREQGFTKNECPDQEQWKDVVGLKDNTIKSGDLRWQYHDKNEVKFGYAPACILLQDGKDVEIISRGATAFSIGKKYNQTLHMQDAKGRHYFAVTEGLLNGYDCRNFAKSYGMVFCAMLDSGGSAQMVVNGVKKRYTGRAIANVLTFYWKETPVPTPEEDFDDMKITVQSVGLNIRNSVMGTKISFIPVGKTANLVDFVPGIQSDGYQWVKVEYEGITGYAQYDSRCYYISRK